MEEGKAHFAEVGRRFLKAQRRKPKDRRLPFEDALGERAGDGGRFNRRASFWRAELAKHPYYKKQYGQE